MVSQPVGMVWLCNGEINIMASAALRLGCSGASNVFGFMLQPWLSYRRGLSNANGGAADGAYS